jgi:hypothetical protein
MSERLVNYIEIGKPSDYHKLNSPNLVDFDTIEFPKSIGMSVCHKTNGELYRLLEELFYCNSNSYEFFLIKFKEIVINIINDDYSDNPLKDSFDNLIKNNFININLPVDINNLPGKLEIHSIIKFRANEELNFNFIRCHNTISDFRNMAELTRVKIDTSVYQELTQKNMSYEDEVDTISRFFTECFSLNFPYLPIENLDKIQYDIDTNDKIFPEICFVLFKYSLHNEVFYFEGVLSDRLFGELRIYSRPIDFFEFFLKFKNNSDTKKSIEKCIAEAEEYTKRLILKNKIRNIIWQFRQVVEYTLGSILFMFVFSTITIFILCCIGIID